MSSYVVAPAARDDLLGIWQYYAEEVGDPDLADRMASEILSGFHTVARTPGIGHLRSDLSKNRCGSGRKAMGSNLDNGQLQRRQLWIASWHVA